MPSLSTTGTPTMQPKTYSKLEALNLYRAACGLDPIAAWRPARHQSMLDAYDAAAQEQIEKGAADDTLAGDQEEFAEIVDLVSEVKALPLDPDPLKEAIHSHDFASSAISDAAKAVKIPPYKTFARYAPSCVDSPCAFVHQFLTDHPDLTRKQAMHVLMQYGINYSTARTQYQKWFANRSANLLAARLAATNATEEG